MKRRNMMIEEIPHIEMIKRWIIVIGCIDQAGIYQRKIYYMIQHQKHPKRIIIPLAGAIEYTDCISAEG